MSDGIVDKVKNFVQNRIDAAATATQPEDIISHLKELAPTGDDYDRFKQRLTSAKTPEERRQAILGTPEDQEAYTKKAEGILMATGMGGEGGGEGEPPEKPPGAPGRRIGPEMKVPPAPEGGAGKPTGGEVGVTPPAEPPAPAPPPTGEAEAAAPEEPPTMLSAQVTKQRQMRLAQDLNLKDNADFVNQWIKKPVGEEATDEELQNLYAARRQSGQNFYKISKEYMDAMAKGDMQRMGDLENLGQHEYSKLLHMEGVDQDSMKLGKSVADQTIQFARMGKDLPDLMRMVSTLESKGRADKVGKMFSDYMGGVDLYTAAVNAQMLNPKIPIEKVMTDSVWMPYNSVVEALGRVPQMGMGDAVKTYLSSMHAYVGAVKDAFGYAAKSFKSGAPEYLKSLGPKAAEENVYADDFMEGTTPGKALSYLGSLFSAGSRAVMSADQFAKTLGGRMETRMAALTRGLQDADEAGMTGGARWKFAQEQAENYQNQMPDWLKTTTLARTAKDTFTNDREAVSKLQTFLSSMKFPETTYTPEIPIGKMLALFVRTPLNMMDAGIYNSAFAPASPQFWYGMKSGGMARDQALAHWAVGSSISALVWHEAMQGNLTGQGPSNKTTLAALQKQGWQPYSIKIGNTYYSYRHLGPLYTMIGTAANAAEIYHEMKTGSEQNRLAMASIASFANLVHNAPMMYMLGTALNGMTEAKAHGEFGDLQKAVSEFATEFIPHPLELAAKIVHPEMTDPKSVVDNLREESPFNRADVPTKHDMFGYPMYVPPGIDGNDQPPNRWLVALNAVNPVQYSHYKPDTVDHEIARTGANIPPWPEIFTGKTPSQSMFSDPNDPRVGLPFSTDPVKNEQMRSRLAELAGHEVTIQGKNMHDYLEAEINKPYYQHPEGMSPMGTKFVQKQIIEGVHRMFLEMGKTKLMDEYPSLREDLIKRAGERRALMFGSGAGAGVTPASTPAAAPTARLGAP